MAIPAVESTTKRLSMNFPLLKAAIAPKGIPVQTARTRASAPTFAETGNFVPIIWDTVLPLFLMDRPKSPFKSPVI